MPVKSFKFVSPGVFINEIDNSFRPRRPDTIGPVVIGRATRGLAMQPVKVESYSDFVTMFGDAVPGAAGGDIYRDGNYQSPMYGTYAAKAFLNASVAPVTYVRLLGSENTNKSTGGEAGWKTTNTLSSQTGEASLSLNGGAFGLWVWKSSSVDASVDSGAANLGTGSLAAIWYVDKDASIQLSGNLAAIADPWGLGIKDQAQGVGMVIESDTNGNFTVFVDGSKGSSGADEKILFNFNDSDQRFVRKVFNTNPQLVQAGGQFHPTSLERNYWLGETFEQEIRDGANGVITGSNDDITTGPMYGVVLPIGNGSRSPSIMQQGTQEARSGYVIGQDLGTATDYTPEGAPKLFRLKGRGHGEWLNKNAKVSIENIRYSNTQTSDFGSFSIVLRSLTDSDNNPVILERFDNLSLDPRSTNYIARAIGDQYYEWNETERRLRLYGEYPNQSKFIYVSDINEGNIQNANSLLPFGYEGPPSFANVIHFTGSAAGKGDATSADIANRYIFTGNTFGTSSRNDPNFLSGSRGRFTGSLTWPVARLRHSASDGGMSDQTDAYFGFQATRTYDSSRGDASIKDYHRLWIPGVWDGTDATGIEGVSYIFTMDDIIVTAVSGAFYSSGSRRAASSKTAEGSYQNLLDAGFDKFTLPLWGGFDGFDITKPDPLSNEGITAGATDRTSYAFNTYKRAIDTVADPEFVDMNLLVTPGLTKDGLTTHMVNVCEDRADALALIDLPGVYLPPHEKYYADIKNRQTKNASQAANDLRSRQIDSSYGATFYPWVQTVDEGTGQSLWIPPSVAMMGVLASSEKTSQIWFAPAGFNRGGLSDGAAGIPVTSVSRRLTSKERDTLYEARINPIASFPSTGIVVFGQKTLQEKPSALDRINVRRLVIFLKKQISILSTQVLFEQNVQATWNRFKGLIEPFLANVKTEFGITDYRLILDESTTTPDLIDQNVVYAKIMIKPARAIEYIAIDFVVASTGASFDD